MTALSYPRVIHTIATYLDPAGDKYNLEDDSTEVALQAKMQYVSACLIYHAAGAPPPELPDRYSFRMQRALRFLPNEPMLLGRHRDLKNVMRWLFDNVTQFLCRGVISSKERRVLTTGVVATDGMGDYFLMTHGGETVRSGFANIRMTYGAEVINLSTRRDRFPPCSIPRIMWGTIRPADRRVGYESTADERERDICVEAAKTADLVLDISHMDLTNTAARTIATTNFGGDIDPIGNNYLRITEYGGNITYLRHLYSMGLYPFSLGVIRKSIPSPDINALQDPLLKAFLLDPSLMPDGCTDLNAGYRATHSLHYGYMPSKGEEFFALTLKYAMRSEKPVIDFLSRITIPTPEWLRALCARMPIKEIILFDKSTGAAPPLKLGETGKILRIINPFPLDNVDVLQLIASSSGPVGCTGNVSISEVQSARKLPFFSGPHYVMCYFGDLTTLAKELFPVDSPLVRYLELVKRETHPDEVLEEMAKLLLDEQTSREWNMICAHLERHHDFNEILLDLVSRSFAFQEIPGLKEKDMALFKAFCLGEKSLIECHREYQAFLTRRVCA